MLILCQSKEQLDLLIPQACLLFEALGLLINKNKSPLTPSQCLEFLVFQICSCTLRISILAKKLRKILQDAHHLLLQISVSVRELARFIGKAMATVWAILIATLHYRALQKLIPSMICSQSATKKFSVILYLSQVARADLTWWTESTKQMLGTPIFNPVARMVIEIWMLPT